MPKNAEKRAQHTVDYNNEEEIFYWLRNPPGGGIKRVMLLKDEWILTLADKIEAAPTDAARAELAVPCRQLLEERDPTAYYQPEEVEALERSYDGAELFLDSENKMIRYILRMSDFRKLYHILRADVVEPQRHRF